MAALVDCAALSVTSCCVYFCVGPGPWYCTRGCGAFERHLSTFALATNFLERAGRRVRFLRLCFTFRGLPPVACRIAAAVALYPALYFIIIAPSHRRFCCQFGNCYLVRKSNHCCAFCSPWGGLLSWNWYDVRSVFPRKDQARANDPLMIPIEPGRVNVR